MPLSRFGPFADVFAKGELEVPGHLELLHLRNAGAQVVISRIEHAISLGDPAPWLRALLETPNWRPHLVAAVAMLVIDGTPCCVDALWSAVDAGSWVTPQLVVAAFVLDAEFANAVRSRVTKGCVIRPVLGLSPAERHSATGPAGVPARSAKLMASLLTVAAHLPSLSEWLERVQREHETEDLLAKDFDDSGRIASDWFAHLTEQFERRGRKLTPTAARHEPRA